MHQISNIDIYDKKPLDESVLYKIQSDFKCLYNRTLLSYPQYDIIYSIPIAE